MNNLKSLNRLLIFISSFLLLINIVGLMIYKTKNNQAPPKKTSSVRAATVKTEDRTDTIQIVNMPSESPKQTPQESNIYGTTMQFNSYNLGLRFHYLTHWWRKTDSIEESPTNAYVSRNTNKVCITYNLFGGDENCIYGQYVFVFKKDVNTPFKQSIETDLLDGNNKDCMVNTRKSGDKEIAEVIPLTDKCAETYSKRGVDRYFQYDKRFPDRFVFVSLSKESIFADTNHTTWEMTLELF